MKNNKIKNKIAVVIYNLGGPNKRSDIEFFLFNLFNDKNIITFPHPFRYLLAKLISKLRKKEATSNYNKLGGKSPLLQNTIKQKQALEKVLDKNTYKVFISMNFCNPLPHETIKEIEKFDPTKIVLVPLYPQFSTTTTASFLDKWNKVFKKSTLNCSQRVICCYYSQKEFIQSSKEIFLNIYNKVQKENRKPYVIFVAHGLPEKIIKSGDPYQWQVENTVKLIVESTNIKDLDYILAYQSRVGPVSWIKPYADEVIIKAAKMNKNIIVVPISFVSEHIETLVELDLEYKNLASSNGAKSYYRAKTVSEDNIFIKGLKNLIINNEEKNKPCPKEFCKCYNANKIANA